MPQSSIRRPRPSLIALPALALALALSACGGGSADGEETVAVTGVDAADVEVIEEWAQALTAGDIDGAAGLFALPSLAQNAGPPLRIDSLADAKLFNSSLPCGAILTEATAAHGLTIATFRLTERPGPGSCGSGIGAEAQTAFGIEDGEIVEWRRVIPADDDGDGAPQAPSSSA
jgi:hypothetical protein